MFYSPLLACYTLGVPLFAFIMGWLDRKTGDRADDPMEVAIPALLWPFTILGVAACFFYEVVVGDDA